MSDLTYRELQKAVQGLQKEVVRGADAIRVKAKEIDDEAHDTARVAEMIGQLRVDTTTVSETRELSRIMRGVSEAAIAYASAGDNTARAAIAAHDQARTTHDGIQEAVTRAPVDNVHDVNREWFRQE